MNIVKRTTSKLTSVSNVEIYQFHTVVPIVKETKT